jgi:hypothetical protein
MNKENVTQVTEVVNGIIVDQLTQMIEDMSNHDFIEMVMDRLEQEGVKLDFENEEVQEEITGIVGGKVIPLMLKITEYVVGKSLPTE